MTPQPTNPKMIRNLLIFAHAMLVVLLNVFISRPEEVTTTTMMVTALAVAGGFGGCIYYATGPMRAEGLSDTKFQAHLLMALALAELPAIISVFFVGTPYSYGVGALSLAVILALILPVSLTFSPTVEKAES